MFLTIFCYSEGIFKKHFNDKVIIIDTTGSSYQEYNGTKQLTKPIYAIDPVDKKYDWCSNCGKSYDEHPWISFSIKDNKFKFNGYFVRCGCCYANCCCEEVGYYVRCCLFSWSLQISDDNKTWTDVHKVEKDYDMIRCTEKSYILDKEYTARFVRIIQNEPCPGDPPCLAINKFDLFGSTVSDYASYDGHEFNSEDDDVSIIGHISHQGNVKIGM